MQQPAVTRRIAVPPLPPRLLWRERLLTRLRSGLRAPLTIVQAEFGFGKTTVLSQFVHAILDAKEAEVVWYTVREKEAHLATFLERLAQSIRQLAPEFGTRLLLNLRECGDNEAEFRDHLVQVFLADLEDLNTPTVIVLDDLHFVDTNEHIFHFLSSIVEELPSHLHIYIGTRRGLPIALDMLRMKNEVIELKRKDLEFTPEEAQSFFSEASQRKLDRIEVDTLVRLTQGWAGAMVLFAKTFVENPNSVIAQFAAVGVQKALHQLIDEQIFKTLREPVVNVLTVANVLGTWDNETLAEIFADEVGRDEIERTVRAILERNEFFLVQTSTDERGHAQYSFNPIFADYLWTKTQPRHTALVAEYYERHGFLWRAVDHFVRAKHWDDAVRVIEHAFFNPPLQDAPTPHERLQIINQVPQEIQQREEIFLLYHAFLLMQNQEFSQSLSLTYSRTVGSRFDLSFRIIELINRIALLGPRDPILAQQCEVLREDIDKISDSGFHRFVFLSLYAVILSSHNRSDEALQLLVGAPLIPGQSPYILARVHAWAGNYAAAKDAYDQLRRDLEVNTRPWELARDLTNATEIALYLGRYDHARTYNRQLKDLSAKYFLRKDGMLADAWSMRIAVGEHEYRTAAAAPTDLVEYFRTRFRPTTADMIVFYRALAHYALGDYTSAWRELLPEAFTHTYDPQRIALKMVLAQEMQLASYEKIFFEQARTIAGDSDMPVLLKATLHQYIAYDLFLKARNAPAGRGAFLGEMHTLLAMPHLVDSCDAPFAMRMYLTAYLWFPELREELYARFLPEAPAVARAARAGSADYSEEDKSIISDLLRRVGVDEVRTLSAESAAPEPDADAGAIMKIACLGEFNVLVNGAPLSHKQWTAKNQELFLFFALHPNEDVLDQDVCHALWPTKMIESARASLMNGVHTLKKIFADVLPEEEGGISLVRNRPIMAYTFSIGAACALDAADFLRLCDEGDAAANTGSAQQAAAAYLQALRRCKGDVGGPTLFGKGAQDIPWIEVERHEYRDRYFRILSYFADVTDPANFPLQDVTAVLTTVMRFREITSTDADKLAAFVNRAVQSCLMRGAEADGDKIHAAYRQLCAAHPSLITRST